ncbi:alpha/beta fold hydrolase [Flindersiella endophytica]
MTELTRRTRRDVLRTSGVAAGAIAGAALGTALAAAPAAASATGAGRGRRPGVTSFVFVTGANGTAGAPSQLAALGHRVLGVDLPGHEPSAQQFTVAYQAPQDLDAMAAQPSPTAGKTLRDYADAVIDVVRQVARYGPVILVGSSMGGAAISLAGNEVPQLIDRLVYDSALLCVDLPTLQSYFETPEGSTSQGPVLGEALVGDPAKTGAVRVNWRWANAEWLAKAKGALMEDGTDAEFLAMLSSLQPDESLGVQVEEWTVDPHTWGRIPRTYIRHRLDRMLPLALQDRLIREADARTPWNRFDVRTVETAHAAPPAKYAEIIRILDGLAR